MLVLIIDTILTPGRLTTRRAVDMIEADMLYLHLNPLQEAVQDAGETNFADLAKKVERFEGWKVSGTVKLYNWNRGNP
ncbi:MAG: hypothetical protein MUO77_13035 [Anaerolineales bacterium]|nr:hypothetical protein [Anaerolineales bacterium]